MAESFLLALREGFEAALIVAIVLAFVRRQAPGYGKAVWLGTGAAVVISMVVGVVLQVTVDGLEGVARMRTFGVICLFAAALLTWMIFWMRAHSRSLKHHLEEKAGEAVLAGSALGLVMVAFTAVLREGIETALFLLSVSSAADNAELILGTLLGLATATVLGVGVYHGSRLIDMRRFFLVTGALVILFAAGLVARAVFFFQASGDLSSWNWAAYDLTGARWLTVDTQSGRFLAGIFGWDPRPSIEQVVAYLAYLIPVGLAFFRSPKAAPTPAAEPADERALEPEPVGAAS